MTEQMPKEKIDILRESGLFDVYSGKVEINIHNGQIQNIHIHRMVYKREANHGNVRE